MTLMTTTRTLKLMRFRSGTRLSSVQMMSRMMRKQMTNRHERGQ